MFHGNENLITFCGFKPSQKTTLSLTNFSLVLIKKRRGTE